MKKSKIVLGLLVILGLSLASSCRKDPDDVKPTLSTKKLLTRKNWRLVSFTIDTAISARVDVVGYVDSTTVIASLDTTITGDPDLNLFAHMSVCEKDNLLYFTTDFTFKREEGERKCSSLSPQVISTGSWVFEDNETIIAMDLGSKTERKYKITTLELGKMTVFYDESYFRYTMSFTY